VQAFIIEDFDDINSFNITHIRETIDASVHFAHISEIPDRISEVSDLEQDLSEPSDISEDEENNLAMMVDQTRSI
jgi:hypothetical protein